MLHLSPGWGLHGLVPHNRLYPNSQKVCTSLVLSCGKENQNNKRRWTKTDWMQNIRWNGSYSLYVHTHVTSDFICTLAIITLYNWGPTILLFSGVGGGGVEKFPQTINSGSEQNVNGQGGKRSYLVSGYTIYTVLEFQSWHPWRPKTGQVTLSAQASLSVCKFSLY